MYFLANENFPFDAVEVLRQNGHDVALIRVDSPGISDTEVLSRAQAENRILLTFDKDFGELAFRSKLPAIALAKGVRIGKGLKSLFPEILTP